MIAAARRIKPRRDGRHPYDQYFLYWTAFNQVFATLAARQGLHTQLVTTQDGTVQTWANGNLKIPKVNPVSESDQMYIALHAFTEALKHDLILHESTKYFKHRIPSWQGEKIEFDAFGQRLNGVIHVGYTSSADYPVWSPIDLQIYETYVANQKDEAARDVLSKQVLDLLYTVRKNLMIFSRKFDDSNDFSVIRHALPLLQLIVAAFTW
jgi:hypothetical protein